MSHTQTRLTEERSRSEIRPTLEWGDVIRHTTPLRRSPFVPVSLYRRFVRGIKLIAVQCIQRCTKRQLYCEEDAAILYELPPETRALLIWLTKKKLLRNWFFGRSVPNFPELKVLYLEPHTITTPGGGVYKTMGANGIGCGTTYAEAALPALGEFIERLAGNSYWWEDRQLHRRRYVPSSATYVDPTCFQYVTAEQDLGEVFATRGVAVFPFSEQSLHWKSARDYVSKRRVYIPASLCYLFFAQEHKEDPIFFEVSSNGTAAHTTYEEAANRALLELIERHNFLKSWYHQGPKWVVSLSSLSEAFVEARMLQELETYAVRSYVLVLQDDLGIPTVVIVQLNQDPDAKAVHVTAAADTDLTIALKKAMQEIVRFAHSSYSRSGGVDEKWDRQTVRDLNERGAFWSKQDMIPRIEWYTQGETVSYEELVARISDRPPHASSAGKGQTEILQAVCRENQLTVYIADQTNAIAKHAGLRVVRAVSPDLIPIFFNEASQPLGMSAFTHNSAGEPVSLHRTPHPFL